MIMTDPRDVLMIGRTIKTTGSLCSGPSHPKVKTGGSADVLVAGSSWPMGGVSGMVVPGIVEVTNIKCS